MAPLSLSLSLSFLPPSSFLVGLGKGNPTPTRRRIPPSLARPLGPAGLPLAPLNTGAGAPHDTQVDLRDCSLAVCGAPLHHNPR